MNLSDFFLLGFDISLLAVNFFFFFAYRMTFRKPNFWRQGIAKWCLYSCLPKNDRYWYSLDR